MNRMLRVMNGGAAVAMVLLAAAGCEQLVGPNGQAEIEATLDGGSQADESAPRTSLSSTGAGGTESGDMVTGTVDVRLRVFVQAATGEWREVTRGRTDQRVEIDGSGGLKVVARSGVAAGEYVRVRLEFDRVEADVSGGLWLGAGPFSGRLRVDAGVGERVIIERELGFSARANARTRLKIALNAEKWLERASTSTGTVAESDFRSAVRIAVE